MIRGVLLPKLIWWLISLIPPIRFLAFKCAAYYFKLVAVILLLNKIMPTCCYGPSVISITVTKGGHLRGSGLYKTSKAMGQGVSQVI